MFEKIVKYLLIALSTASGAWIFVGIFTSIFDFSTNNIVLGLGVFIVAEIAVCTGMILAKIGKSK